VALPPFAPAAAAFKTKSSAAQLTETDSNSNNNSGSSSSGGGSTTTFSSSTTNSGSSGDTFADDHNDDNGGSSSSSSTKGGSKKNAPDLYAMIRQGCSSGSPRNLAPAWRELLRREVHGEEFDVHADYLQMVSQVSWPLILQRFFVISKKFFVFPFRNLVWIY
jgi:hypothetical protein